MKNIGTRCMDIGEIPKWCNVMEKKQKRLEKDIIIIL